MFRSRNDPAADYYGSAEDEDPGYLKEIKDDLSASGVAIRMHDREHEYSHFCYDRENGYPGVAQSMFNKDYRKRSEEIACDIEIVMARE